MMRKIDQKDFSSSTSRLFLRRYHNLAHYRSEENCELVNQECHSVSRTGNTDTENAKQKCFSLDQDIYLHGSKAQLQK